MALRASLGRYYSVSSPVHSLDPRVKVVLTCVYMLGCLLVGNLPTFILAAAALAAAVAAARVPLPRLLSQARPLILFLVVTSLVNLMFIRQGATLASLGPMEITSGGVMAAVLYTARFLLLLLSGALLMFTTAPTALTDALGSLLSPLKRAGVPVEQAVLVISIALRFVPTLAHEADNIVAAQTARGADLEGTGRLSRLRALVPLAVPLFLGALRHANNLGRALDARCYTGGSDRTRYRELKLSLKRDGTAIILGLAYVTTLIILALP